MDLRAQSQSENQGQSPSSAGAADVLSTAASTVRDALASPEQTQGAGVKTVNKRLPQSAHSAVYEAVHAATEAAESLEREASGWMRNKDQFVKATTDYVDASPLKAVTFAFLAGWIVGRITR